MNTYLPGYNVEEGYLPSRNLGGLATNPAPVQGQQIGSMNPNLIDALRRFAMQMQMVNGGGMQAQAGGMQQPQVMQPPNINPNPGLAGNPQVNQQLGYNMMSGAKKLFGGGNAPQS